MLTEAAARQHFLRATAASRETEILLSSQSTLLTQYTGSEPSQSSSRSKNHFDRMSDWPKTHPGSVLKRNEVHFTLKELSLGRG